MGKLTGEQCDICGGVLAAQTTDFEFRREKQLFIVEYVPADVCTQCGEKYFSAATLHQIEQLFEQTGRTPARYMNIPVYEFEIAC